MNGTRDEMKNLLLVEDNAAHAELIMRSMEEVGFDIQIHHVEDGEKALDFLHHRNEYTGLEFSSSLQLILLDLRLPKVSGLAVLEDIKSSDGLRDIPVVILSTSAAQQDISRAYNKRANSYLVKPTDFQKLKTIMTGACTYWLKLNVSASI